MQTEKTNGPRERAECVDANQSLRKANKSIDEGQSVLPANLTAERCVLGAIIEDETLWPRLAELGLCSQDFFLSDHRRIFEALQLLKLRNVPIDFVTVAEELGNSQHDYVLIGSLIHGVVLNEDHVLYHAAIVRKKARVRAVLKIGAWLTEVATESADPDRLIAEATAKLEACSEGAISA
jgi:replicative DNA helicase